MEGVNYRIQSYRPRIEGLFARIERWTNIATSEVHWRSISKDNITTLYGKTSHSRIFNPAEPNHIFSWLIGESYDDKGNLIVYEYLPEDSKNVDLSQVYEKNRTDLSRPANRYLKRIRYGNYPSRLILLYLSQTTLGIALAVQILSLLIGLVLKCVLIAVVIAF